MTAKNPNQADKAKSDAKSPVGACPLMKNKVQLLPLRYGLVERLDPSAELRLPYRLKSRPLGIRLIRDGWLYVIDNETGYLHEYRVEKGVVSKFVWKGKEAAQDQRQGKLAEHSLVFARGSTLHVSFSEVQWTAFKCSQMLKSRKEREHFMQRVDLSKATCAEGGEHLLTSQQAESWLAEVAESPSGSTPPSGADPQEGQDYAWESTPLYNKTTIGLVKKQLLPIYEHDQLYLVFKDSLGVMQDLAQEQDTVVGWIEKWIEQGRNDLKYSIGSYIETLMVLNDDTAKRAGTRDALFEKTTPAQRQTIYDYLNARNDLKGIQSSSPATAHYPGRGFDLKTRAARASVAAKKHTMQKALGDDLYDELGDDIEALKDHSDAALDGKGLGARGIHDLVRHKEMRQYLEQERAHLKRWNARLDRITEDRVTLFTATEYHRSAWYFDTKVPDQQMAALVMEQNCVRDLCRTEESLKAVGEYFHKYPYYILPAFASRLDLNFLTGKSGDLIKWLDDARNLKSGLGDAQVRLQEVGALLGNHWTNSLSLSASAQTVSQAVNAAYSPAIALRLQDWLAGVQSELNSPDLKAHLDKLDTYSNRAHRLGSLAELKAHGANLVVATEQDVSLFKSRLTTLIELLDKENLLNTLRDRAKTDSKRRTISEAERQNVKAQKQQLNQQLAAVRQQRTAIINQLQNSVTATGAVQAGFVGVKLKMDAAQQNLLNEEIRRLRLGPRGGYGERGAHAAAVKSSALPLVALFLQVRNFGEALNTWQSAANDPSLKDYIVFAGALFAPVSSALSVYQNAHIVLVDQAFKSIVASSAGKGGMQFAVKLGKLGLGLGVVISPLALLGSAGTSWSNWNKWLDATRTGTTGERAGALMALAGDTSSTAVNAAITAKAFAEFGGLMMEASRAAPGQRVAVMGAAWATRGVRFLSFSARLTPWGLAATALQFGGEALYNYGNLDDEQRWMLNSCWGLEDQDWDWPTHSQHLAEATLRPEISDKGTIERALDGASVRRLVISLPGVSLASLRHQPLRLTAEWEYQRGWPAQDVGEQVRKALCKLDDTQLALTLDISPDWVGPQSQLRLRLAVQPQLADKPLKHKDAYLYYAVPLRPTASRKPIKGMSAAGPTRIAPQWLDITPEYLNATG
ncbi:toxin VasX [Stutzerimonas zhaodongensis]|uniref:toxin VasX n=1 Tax=Stutzerimonas TaxID=2901164 RepID=UPI00388E6462